MLAYALIAKSRELTTFPRLGKVVREFEDENIRELVLSPFRIVYRIDNERGVLGVARYWHVRRGYLVSRDLEELA